MMIDPRALLTAFQDGELSLEEALSRLQTSHTEEMEFARVDHHRAQRCGLPEVVYGQSKSTEQIVSILQALVKRNGYAFATRLKEETFSTLESAFPGCSLNRQARTVLCGTPPTPAPNSPVVGVIAAGTSDLDVAEEAAATLQFAGITGKRIFDVGVAGLHRLLAVRSALEECSVLIVIAGMEGALPTVVGGLVSRPVIAVPTSVGYGAAFGGIAALLGMLNSCASGISVVNIDNGFGAGICAARIVNTLTSFTDQPAAEGDQP
ncbi:MAG: nickel pincer cofactor biosynthesis protein LarB [Planctomycetota bacterium]|jgi:NCAIR mutase (PurE)-related protein